MCQRWFWIISLRRSSFRIIILTKLRRTIGISLPFQAILNFPSSPYQWTPLPKNHQLCHINAPRRSSSHPRTTSFLLARKRRQHSITMICENKQSLVKTPSSHSKKNKCQTCNKMKVFSCIPGKSTLTKIPVIIGTSHIRKIRARKLTKIHLLVQAEGPQPSMSSPTTKTITPESSSIRWPSRFLKSSLRSFQGPSRAPRIEVMMAAQNSSSKSRAKYTRLTRKFVIYKTIWTRR